MIEEHVMEIRLARREDAAGIRSIYNEAVTGSFATFDLVPWSVGDGLAWLDQHQGAHPSVVAVAAADPASAKSAIREGRSVIGFGALSPFRARPGYATSVEDSVYVDSSNRQTGVGRAILQELIRLAGDHGFHTVLARTEGGNEGSIALHKACGFEVVGIEREVGRKHGKWLDVIELQLML